MRINYILIDYENLQPKDIAALNQEHFRVMLFAGAHQAKIPFELAAAMQQMGGRAEYNKISGNGSNALDFHIAFYIGRLALEKPDAYFHIISKDSAFDPLIQHLKAKKIFACRSTDVSQIPLLKIANSKTLDEKVQAVVANLQQRGASKPRTVKTFRVRLRRFSRSSYRMTNWRNCFGSCKQRGLSTSMTQRYRMSCENFIQSM